jgi:hypothetical protein
MKARTELRRAKLPPILEIDEDGIPVSEHAAWGHPRWTAGDDADGVQAEGVQMDDWPTELDD